MAVEVNRVAEALGVDPTVFEVYDANGQPHLRPAAEEEEEYFPAVEVEEGFFDAEPQGSSA